MAASGRVKRFAFNGRLNVTRKRRHVFDGFHGVQALLVSSLRLWQPLYVVKKGEKTAAR